MCSVRSAWKSPGITVSRIFTAIGRTLRVSGSIDSRRHRGMAAKHLRWRRFPRPARRLDAPPREPIRIGYQAIVQYCGISSNSSWSRFSILNVNIINLSFRRRHEMKFLSGCSPILPDGQLLAVKHQASSAARRGVSHGPRGDAPGPGTGMSCRVGCGAGSAFRRGLPPICPDVGGLRRRSSRETSRGAGVAASCSRQGHPPPEPATGFPTPPIDPRIHGSS